MNRIAKIITKIERIEKLLRELREELKELPDETLSKSDNRKNSKAPYPIDKLQRDHEELYRKFVDGNNKAVHAFVESKDKNYLVDFCKANDISHESAKGTKSKLADDIVQWFVQRRAISKRAT